MISRIAGLRGTRAATAGPAPHAAHATGTPPPALAAAPAGFTVADLTAKAGAMTGQQD
ncbi:MAG: hypothetical protein WAK58_06080 [Trebonia sp.]